MLLNTLQLEVEVRKWNAELERSRGNLSRVSTSTKIYDYIIYLYSFIHYTLFLLIFVQAKLKFHSLSRDAETENARAGNDNINIL